MSRSFSLIFSSKSSIVLALPLRSLIHFKLTFVHGVRKGPALLHMWVFILPALVVERLQPFPVECVRSQLTIRIKGYFWAFYSTSLVYMSSFIIFNIKYMLKQNLGHIGIILKINFICFSLLCQCGS